MPCFPEGKKCLGPPPLLHAKNVGFGFTGTNELPQDFQTSRMQPDNLHRGERLLGRGGCGRLSLQSADYFPALCVHKTVLGRQRRTDWLCRCWLSNNRREDGRSRMGSQKRYKYRSSIPLRPFPSIFFFSRANFPQPHLPQRSSIFICIVPLATATPSPDVPSIGTHCGAFSK